MDDFKDKKLLINMKNIVKKYYIGEPNELEILHGIDLKIYEGEFVAIVGESGSGKSTLMNIIGVLDKPTEGEYYLDGISVQNASEKDMNNIRNQKIGFVFQNSLLFEDFSAFENVLITLTIAGLKQKEAMEKAEDVLISVGLKERMSHRPKELSGGERQRVAIARAICNDAGLVFLDEPTGSLDEESKSNVEELLFSHMMRKERSLVIVTHDADLSMKADSRYVLRGGILERV